MGTRKTPLTEEAYKLIKDMIINMYMRPGEVLIAQQLVLQLNISRTPIREALVKLAQEGLVQPTESGKFQVSYITQSAIVELYDVRGALELLALQHVFGSFNEQDIVLMEENLDTLYKSYKSNDSTAFFKCDNDFHDFWITKYNNQIVKNFMSQLTDQQKRIRYITMYVQNRMYNTLEEHRNILDSIKAKDYKATAQAITLHLQNVKQDILDYIDQNAGSPNYSPIFIYGNDLNKG